LEDAPAFVDAISSGVPCPALLFHPGCIGFGALRLSVFQESDEIVFFLIGEPQVAELPLRRERQEFSCARAKRCEE